MSVLTSGASDGDASVAPRTTATASNISAFVSEDAGQSVPARPNPTAAQLDATGVIGSPVEWVKQPEDVVPLALMLAGYPGPGPTGQSFSLMRRTS